MEGVNQKVDRINGDVQNLIELYDFAEKLYPYENLREEQSVLFIQNNFISWMRMREEDSRFNLLPITMEDSTSMVVVSGVWPQCS